MESTNTTANEPTISEILADQNKVKKMKDKERVFLLERAVLDGTDEDVKNVLSACAPFEFTARALGFAMRYGGAEKTRLLIDAGATFKYAKEEKGLNLRYHVAMNDLLYKSHAMC